MEQNIIMGELLQKNKEFSQSNKIEFDNLLELKDKHTKGQWPKSIVIACSDSRVPPELIFKQSIGDLFIIRVAGNVLSNDVIASAEYAINHAGVEQVIVLGHTSCGAVGAAMQPDNDSPFVKKLLDKIRPCIKEGMTIDEVAIDNVNHQVESFKNLLPSITTKAVNVVGAFYDLESGIVEVLENKSKEISEPVEKVLVTE